VPQLVHAEVPVTVETPVKAVDRRGTRLAAQRGPGEMAEQRRRFGVRHAQRFPVPVMVRAVLVRQRYRDDGQDRKDFREQRSPTPNHLTGRGLTDGKTTERRTAQCRAPRSTGTT